MSCAGTEPTAREAALHMTASVTGCGAVAPPVGVCNESRGRRCTAELASVPAPHPYAERLSLEETPPNKEQPHPHHRTHRDERPAARPHRPPSRPQPVPAAACAHLPNRPVPRPDHRPRRPRLGPDGLVWRRSQRARQLWVAAGESGDTDGFGRRGLAHEPGGSVALGAWLCAGAVWVDVFGVGGVATSGLVVTA